MTERPPPPDRGSSLWTRWREVDRLFEAALDIPESDRVAFLREHTAGDTELFDLLAELLEITDTADTKLDRSCDSVLRLALAGSDADAAGRLEARPDAAPRHDSAAAPADDLRRHLAGRPDRHGVERRSCNGRLGA